jgi:hypothetical protein
MPNAEVSKQVRRTGAAIAVVVAAAVVAPAAHDPITTKVSWNREIAPIFQARCVSCHSADGRAPMSLATYADARPWARAIREEVLARRMPKWPVVRGYGDFRNDRSLSPFEIALITAWVDGGAPQSTQKGASNPVPRPAVAQERAAEPPQVDRRILPCRSQRLPGGRLIAIEPRLAAGGSLRVTLEYADGSSEPLLWIREFDPRFAESLQLRTPAIIRDGTRLNAVAPDDCTVTIAGEWK